MKKILLIDDEKEMHSLILGFFPKELFRVVSAFDGIEGLMKCKNEDFDIILLDSKMPKMDGARFYQQFRDFQESKKSEPTPIIFISGFVEELKGRNQNWIKCDFLNKPIQKEELFLKMQKITDKKPSPKTEKIFLSTGEILFSENEKISHLFYVVSGKLELINSNEHVISHAISGELIGESIVLDETACYTVRALEDSELILIPSDKILEVVRGQPKWIKLLIEGLGKRLKESIKQIA